MQQERAQPGSTIGTANELINLHGAEYITCVGYPADCDAVEVTIVLTELQRSRAIAMSNTPGGDGEQMTVTFLEGALRGAFRLFRLC